MKKSQKAHLLRNLEIVLITMSAMLFGGVILGAIFYLSKNTTLNELVLIIRISLVVAVLMMIVGKVIQYYTHPIKKKSHFIVLFVLTLIIGYIFLIPILNKLIGVNIAPSIF